MNPDVQDQTPDQARNLNFYPKQENSTEDLRFIKGGSNYSEYNDRDSKFGEMFHNELAESNLNTNQKSIQ